MKFGRYLLYALGEIILVVVGILLALNINNYSEETKQQKTLEGILKNVVYDLEVDTLIIGQTIKYYEARQKIAKKIINDEYGVEDFKSCLFCGNMLSTFAPLTLNDKGYGQLKDYSENSNEKDSLVVEVVQFYKATSSLVIEMSNQVQNNAFENIKYWKDTQPWFSNITAGRADPRFFEYMLSQDYKNRTAYYYAIACNNLVAILKGYQKNAMEVIKRINTRIEPI